VYDYRSQAASVRGDIRTDLVGLADWGRLDMEAAVRTLDRLYPEVEMAAVEHSVGGWVRGLCESQARIARHAFICAGWGYIKLKPFPFRAVEMFFWHIYGPLCIKQHGHIPKGGLWKGEAINPKFFAEWKAWCHTASPTPELIAGGRQQPQSYAEVKTPIANPRMVPMILSLYPNAEGPEVWPPPRITVWGRSATRGCSAARLAQPGYRCSTGSRPPSSPLSRWMPGRTEIPTPERQLGPYLRVQTMEPQVIHRD
jgi:hypothetical protein